MHRQIFNFSPDIFGTTAIKRKVNAFLLSNNGHGAVMVRSELVTHPLQGLVRQVEIRYNTLSRKVAA